MIDSVEDIRKKYIKIHPLFELPKDYELYSHPTEGLVYLVFEQEIVSTFQAKEKRYIDIFDIALRHQEYQKKK
jgi:hypothetical protein